MTNDLIIISIETSCDETSVAAFKNNQLLAHVISSSSDKQAKYGGVVPELASRYHEQNIIRVFLEVVKKAKLDLQTITHVAYTALPGLPGCLHVGKVFAKQLAVLTNAKLIPVNHLHAHVFSSVIDHDIALPALGLVVSGGETCIYLVRDFDDLIELNKTGDDAVGEVYDKIARLLDWPYPGGPMIDQNYDPKKSKLMFVKPSPASAQFSFSGLKTAIINYVHNLNQKNIRYDRIEIASSFQFIVINDIIKKLQYYAAEYKITNILVGGGVSANSLLRTKLLEQSNWNVFLASLVYTGDNAAMIGAYAYGLLKLKK